MMHGGHLARLAVELLAQGERRADNDCFQRLHGLRSRFNRRVAGHLEMADHLDRAGVRLR